MYINAHTYYSLRYGIFSPEQLVQEVAKTGVKELVLTDINNTSATFQFIQACKKYNIKPIVGIEFRKDHEFLYLGIAQNKEGWRELNAFLTHHSIEDLPLPYDAPQFENVYIIYRNLHKEISALKEYEYIGIRPEEANKIYRTKVKNHQKKLIVFAPITFENKTGFATHKLLRCIDLNIILGNLKTEDHAHKTEIITPLTSIKKAFEAYPTIIENTQKLLNNCSIEMGSSPLNNRKHFTGSKEDDFKLLSKLALNGCKHRFGKDNKEAVTRTQKELKVINDLNFESYFLITWDIIRYAHSSGYHHIGRGSAILQRWSRGRENT